jgi:hypothetical protein
VNEVDAGAPIERLPPEHGGLKVAITAPHVDDGLLVRVSVRVAPLVGLSL